MRDRPEYSGSFIKADARLRESRAGTSRIVGGLAALIMLLIVGVWGYGMYSLPAGTVIQRPAAEAEAPEPPFVASSTRAAKSAAPAAAASAAPVPKARETAAPAPPPTTTPTVREQIVHTPNTAVAADSRSARPARAAGPVRPGLAPPELRFETSEDVNDGTVYSAKDNNVNPPIVLYPQELGRLPRAMRRDDMALIEVVINEDGTVAQAKAQEAPRTLDDAMMMTMSLSAAKSWRFQPAQKDGRAVRYRQTIPVSIR